MTTESESLGGGISLFILLIESSSEATTEASAAAEAEVGESVIFVLDWKVTWYACYVF